VKIGQMVEKLKRGIGIATPAYNNTKHFDVMKPPYEITEGKGKVVPELNYAPCQEDAWGVEV
jgi:hypothetical protein